MPQPIPADSLPLADTSAVADSLKRTADSLAAAVDSLTSDTTSSLQQAAQDVGDASELLMHGRWDLFLERLYSTLVRAAAEFVPSLIKALVVFFLLYGVYRLVSSLMRRVLDGSDRMDEGLKSLLRRSFRIVSFLLIFVMVLAQFGIDITVLVGGLSIAGLAIGFAAKDTLENFISGIAIMLDRPFRVGDQVEVAGTYGTVVDISLRSTRLRTIHNEIMVMPNLQMINQKLVNHAMLRAVRVSVPFSIAYHESPDHARRVLLPLLEGDERMAEEPPPHVVVTKLADSGVEMELRFFLLDPSMEVPSRLEFLERVHATLGAEGIEIPFPQMDVHLRPNAPKARPAEPLVLDAGETGEAAAPLLDVEGAVVTDDVRDLEQKVENAEADDAPPQ